MDIRLAMPSDAIDMKRVLKDIVAVTGWERPADPAFILANYIANPLGVRCSVAVDAVEVLGFQSLIRAVAGNAYDVPEGWGIIGTHISPRAHRKGVGTALFHASRRAANIADLEKIDAYIQGGNTAALRYYDSLGFKTYRERNGVIQKAFLITRQPEIDGGL